MVMECEICDRLHCPELLELLSKGAAPLVSSFQQLSAVDEASGIKFVFGYLARSGIDTPEMELSKEEGKLWRSWALR
jgi:hypothetical protein